MLGEVVGGVVGHEGGDDDHVELARGLGDLGGEGLEGEVVAAEGRAEHLVEGRDGGLALQTSIRKWNEETELGKAAMLYKP